MNSKQSVDVRKRKTNRIIKLKKALSQNIARRKQKEGHDEVLSFSHDSSNSKESFSTLNPNKKDHKNS